MARGVGWHGLPDRIVRIWTPLIVLVMLGHWWQYQSTAGGSSYCFSSPRTLQTFRTMKKKGLTFDVLYLEIIWWPSDGSMWKKHRGGEVHPRSNCANKKSHSLCNRHCSVTVTCTLMSDAAAAPDVTSSISAWTSSSFFLFTTITCSFFLLLSQVKGS